MENIGNIILGIMIPFAGTTLGAACVYFMKKGIRQNVEKGLLGFASGVMVAASVWSLLIPSMNLSADLGRLAFLPAVTGFFCGILFLLFLDGHVPHLHIGCDEPEGPSCTLKKNTMLVLAVTLHNIPEGMAVGVMFAGLLDGKQRDHLSRCVCPVRRDRDPELPGGRDHFPAAQG